MFLMSLYAIAITVGLCLYWFLHSITTKKPSSYLEAAPSSESKDPPEDNGGCSSGMHYLKPHKSPRKVQLKEVHHSNETASVRVMTPDGVTLVETNERKEEKSTAKGPHKRRPAPPPPPKQPPRRPPPPPPPVTPPPTEVVVVVDKAEDEKEALEKLEDLKIDVHGSGQLLSSARSNASSNQMLQGYALSPTSPPSSYCGEADGPASPELPLPPHPSAEGNEIINACDEPLPPPPDPRDMEVQPRMLDSTSLIYPKNSYMSYRSERKLGRQGFDGKYRRSFHTSASSMDLTTFDSSFQDGKNVFSPSSWEQIHNIRQHGTTVIFHSDCLQQGTRLQRSSSQDCVPVEETANNGSAHISSIPSLQNSEKSSNSINVPCSETQDHHHQQSVPYQPPSHERVNFEIQTPNSPSDSRQNSHRTKGISSESKFSDDIVNCKTSPDSHCSLSLDNGSLTDGDLNNSEADANVDLNQNSVKNNKSEQADSQTLNGTDINNRINSATQTTDTPRLKRKYCKTKAELECEQLSLDFIHHYGDVNLKNLLVPTPNHKTMSDYLEGLLNIELEKNGLHARNNFSSKNQSCERDEKRTSGTVEAKVINDCVEVNDNNQNVDNDLELKKKKEELIESIGKKLESLKDEQKNIRGEMIQNELVGKEIANKLQTLAKPNEMEKYLLHVEEMEKIVNLLLSLSGRLARAENIFKNMQGTHSPEEKKLLEAKRDKLREQYDDACRLKESLDRRSNYVSTFLHKYFSDKDYAEYDRFIKMKTKLIVDIREIDEKINLGEEQLAALSVVAHLWKSANS